MIGLLYQFVYEIFVEMENETDREFPFVSVLVVVIDLNVSWFTLDEELNSYFIKGIKI